MPRIPRKRPIDYILPFLIMICAGVIVVLSYQLWSALKAGETENDIYMYIAQGNARILPWGVGEWERAYSGTRVLQGDSIKTQSGGRVVIELFEDHFIRMDEGTEITFNEISINGGVYEVGIILSEGMVWLNGNENSERPVKFTVGTNHTVSRTVSTVYCVEQTSNRESVRVIEGSLIADILIDEDGRRRKVETISIGVGQEAVITESDLREYSLRRNPSVIRALSDAFRESSFYRWNMAEDKNPTNYSIMPNGFDSYPFDDDEFLTEDDDLPEAEGELATPVITVPSVLNFETSEDSLTIRGTTVAQTDNMMVDVTSNGETQTYKLNLYVPGNTEWSFAISESAGTMNAGKNTYRFYAITDNGLESSKRTLTVIYSKIDDEEEEEDLDLGPLTAPEVNTFNGTTSNTVETGEVKVEGSVSGAKNIIVNGYTLAMFKPGDNTWTYYARESLGNLKPGENTYKVEAVSPDGSKKTTEFTIIYDKPEEEPEVEEPEVEEPEAEEPEVEPEEEPEEEEPEEEEPVEEEDPAEEETHSDDEHDEDEEIPEE